MKDTLTTLGSKIQIITVLLLLLPTFFFAQSAFDKFDGQDGVNSIIV
jgi:hypothetical protein